MLRLCLVAFKPIYNEIAEKISLPHLVLCTKYTICISCSLGPLTRMVKPLWDILDAVKVRGFRPRANAALDKGFVRIIFFFIFILWFSYCCGRIWSCRQW